MVLSNLHLELREGNQKFPSRLGIILQEIASAFFIANNWLQLGWRPPYEVSKNLADLVPLLLGMELFILYNLSSGFGNLMLTIIEIVHSSGG
jgi:hypothetical protein